MTDGEELAEDGYFVVRNHEDQYSIWRADLPLPERWSVVGEAAPKASCLERIEVLWTDLRPASLRAEMTAAGRGEGT